MAAAFPTAAAIALTLAIVPACALTGDTRTELEVRDARLVPLWTAAASFDRSRYGFLPLPTSGRVFWEHIAGGAYDDMLHLGETQRRTSRTIAFRRVPGGYRWLGEQQTFRGRDDYMTVDGREREQLSLTYEEERISGVPLGRLVIRYAGSDVQMMKNDALTLHEIRPLLEKWGY